MLVQTMSEEQRLRLGDMLVAAGLIRKEQLESALASQKTSGRKLGAELVALGLLSEVQMTQVLSNQLSVPWVSLYHVELTRDLLSLVPAPVAESTGAIPVYVRKVRREGDTLFVAMDDPTNTRALALLREATGMPVKPMVAAPSEVADAIRVYYFGGRPRTVHPPAPAPSPESAPVAASEPKRAAPPPKPATEKPKEPQKPEAKAEPKKPRTITLTLLDGTTVKLPAPGSGAKPDETQASTLTTNDLVRALFARARGEDVKDVLPDDRWETLFATLLTLLLRRGLIADWEFIEELEKHSSR